MPNTGFDANPDMELIPGFDPNSAPPPAPAPAMPPGFDQDIAPIINTGFNPASMGPAQATAFDTMPGMAPAPAPTVGQAFVDPTDGLHKMITSTGEIAILHPELHKDIIAASAPVPQEGGASGAWEGSPAAAASQQPAVGTTAPAEGGFAGPVSAQTTQVAATPGGMVKTAEKTTTKTEQAHADPKLAKALAEEDRALAGANTAAADTLSKMHENQAKILEKQNSDLEQQARDHARRAQDLQMRQDEALSRINRLSDEYSNAKIDPDLFGRMDTGNKILASVSLMLGGLSQAFTDAKTNPAMDVLDKAIERDIEAQKSNIAKTGNNLQQSRGIYQELLNATGDERAADAAYRATLLGMAQQQVAQLAAKSNSQTVKDNAKVQNAELASRRAAEANKAGMITTAKLTEADRMNSGIGGAPVKLNQEQSKSLTELQKLHSLSSRLQELAADPDVQDAMGPVKGKWNEYVAHLGGKLPPKVAEFHRKFTELLGSKEKGELGRFSQFGSQLEEKVLGGGLKSDPANTLETFKQLTHDLSNEYDSTRNMILNPSAALQQGLPGTRSDVQGSVGFKK